MGQAFVCSYPRSGSSYLRFLMDKNTDYCIGTSHHTNKFDVKLTTINPSQQKPIIAMKTHHPQKFRLTGIPGRQEINNDMDASLLILIRNPYDVLKSWNKLKQDFQINDKCIRNFCDDWNNFISFYENLNGNKKMFLTYEKLILETKESLQAACKFFNISMNSDFKNVDRQESIKRSEPAFIGPCKILHNMNFYTSLQINQIQNLCGKYIIKYFPDLTNEERRTIS